MSLYKNESHIYYETKQILLKLGWTPIAGEPSGGSDELPRIEIRDFDNRNKGSKGSYKVDLISIKDDCLLLTEIKTNFNQSDISKLNEICGPKREALNNAIRERLNMDISQKRLIKSLSINRVNINKIPSDFVCFNVESDKYNLINKHLLSEY